MRSTHIILSLFTAAALISSVSCKKFLDQQPVSQAADQTGWKTDGDANTEIVACYALTRAAENSSLNPYAYGDLPTDEFNDITNGGDGAYQNVIRTDWAVSIPLANTYDPRMKLRVYTPYYTAIAESNRCLHFIPTMPVTAFNGVDADGQAARKNNFLGEAYFTRAFNYFLMARQWGDVPLVTEYVKDASTLGPIARTPQAQILAQCISDIHMATQYLSWKDKSSSDQAIRADKGAAFALLAHIYAWKGDYDSCRMACDSVINSGSYDLVDGNNYMNIYKGQSSESIFEIAQNTQAESQLLNVSISQYTLISPYINIVTTPAWTINSGTFNQLYSDASDLRLQKAFYQVDNGGTTTISCIKYSNVKYIPTTGDPIGLGIAMNNIIVFRLADIMLLKAEALASGPNVDEAGALAIVNTIRARAGITTPLTGITGTDLITTISDERGRELFLEGSRFYDLVRLARKTGILKFPYINASEFQAGKYYWPVDPLLFTLNSLLTQTPFWADKIR